MDDTVVIRSQTAPRDNSQGGIVAAAETQNKSAWNDLQKHLAAAVVAQRLRDLGVKHPDQPPETRVVSGASVYDRCTITPAEWHFRHFILFIECVSYGFKRLWKSSTPTASTIYRKLSLT